MSDVMDSNAFHNRLRAARNHRHFGQGELASKARLPATTISHFESGTRKPSFENLKRLAQALAVSTDYLLGRVDQMDLGVAGDPLYRHMENLTGQDREYAEVFLKALAEKGRLKGEG